MRRWTVSLIDMEGAKVSATIAVGEMGVLVVPEIVLQGVTVTAAVGHLGPGQLEHSVEAPPVGGRTARFRAVLDWEHSSVELFARVDQPGTYLEVEDGLDLGPDLLRAVA